MVRNTRISVGVLAAMTVAAASACGGGDTGSVGTGSSQTSESGVAMIGPVTMSVEELPGATVELAMGRVLNINTGDVPVTGYSGEVADRRVAKFEKGRDDGSAQFNPGVTSVSPGTTEVTMTNEDAGIAPIRFTVVVTPG